MLDASGQALAYIYAREAKSEADIAKALTFDERRRIAVNVGKLPGLSGSPECPRDSFHLLEIARREEKFLRLAGQ